MADSYATLNKLEASLDRFQEAHFWIHMLEQYYHYADPFRWHLNAFLKSIKEITQLIQMELQNEPGFTAWFRHERTRLSADPLLGFLGKQRDLVVHRGMLVPHSHASIGLTEGRGLKMGFTVTVPPSEDSDHAMHRYLSVAARDREDFLSLLTSDEDSAPCVWRIWRMPPFEEEITDLVATAWLRTGETVNAVVAWLGAEPAELSLQCRHSGQGVQFRLYERSELKRQLRELRKSMQNPERGVDTSNSSVQRTRQKAARR